VYPFKRFILQWIGDIRNNAGGSSKLEMKIFMANPSYRQYALEFSRLSGDIPPFYAFLRQFYSLLNNVSEIEIKWKAEEEAVSSQIFVSYLLMS
jgi:hypothetical protein